MTGTHDCSLRCRHMTGPHDWITWLLYKMDRHMTASHNYSIRCRHMTGYKMYRHMTGSHDCYIRCTDVWVDKGNNKITELRTILQRESQNS